jgi:EAL domain-containing protein (putative c-di-GMP-specific phosphodiesterase class I)/CheY-like chemotaxis protein
MRRIRVMVAEDELAVREAIAGLLADSDRVVVSGSARDADEAIAVADQVRPDVVLLDVRMPGGGGVRAAREIRSRHPEARVIALSAYRDRESVMEMLRAGAVSYVTKDASPEELVEAIVGALEREAPPVPFAGHVLRGVDASLDPDETGRRIERIARVLSGDELRVVFQPVVHLASGRAVGFEALARFPEGEGSPESWFTLAASVGSLVELELATVGLALAAGADLPAEAALFLNLSPSTAASPALRELLLASEAPRVVLEVTERAPVEDYSALREALARLRELGARFAVDDAGAGFASLQHVLELAPDFMKLDRALIREIDVDAGRRALVAGLLPVAAEIGARVIAEGIETDGQLATLRDLGVPYGQGYLLARPAPLAELMGAGDGGSRPRAGTPAPA